MLTVGFDTETTKLANFRIPAWHPSQPRLVQLAALLVEDDGDGNFTEVAGISLIIKPDGFEIPKDASDINGTTTEKANRCGVPLIIALAAFSNLVKLADRVIAHNIQFDAFVMNGEFARAKKPNRMAQKNQFCTMTSATDLVKMPPTPNMINAGFGDQFKPPNLTELHHHCFGVPFEGAHDALEDVRAMLRCYPYVTRQKLRAEEYVVPLTNPKYGVAK